jgi:hypothetical protein
VGERLLAAARWLRHDCSSVTATPAWLLQRHWYKEKRAEGESGERGTLVAVSSMGEVAGTWERESAGRCGRGGWERESAGSRERGKKEVGLT